jgi:guanylate kinase
LRPGIPFVVAAPSGTGKTTVCRKLVESDPGLRFSVSHTTRAPRPGEEEGQQYYFVSAARFAELVESDAFIEHAEYAGHRYGTSRAAIDGPLAEGLDLLLEIEVQGAAQIRSRRADARFVFLLPPTPGEAERRLRARGQDDAEAIERRVELMRRELRAVSDFDYVVVNDDLDDCVAAMREIVAAERAGTPEAARARHGREAVRARLGARFPA